MMNKEDKLKELNKIIDSAKIAFSDDFLSIPKKKDNINSINIKNILLKNKIEPIKKELKNTSFNFEEVKESSLFYDKNYFELEKIVLNCSKCEAANIRQNIIFGKGNRPSTLMVIGEGPGREEDLNNDIFVGKSGQYLYKWLESINLNVEQDVYLSNIVKCYSSTNPTKEIVSACSPYLVRQIELVNPKVILVLGKIAANFLFNLDMSMKDYRGKIYTYKRIPSIVTYHPAAVLRNPEWRRPVWEDLKKIKQLISI